MTFSPTNDPSTDLEPAAHAVGEAASATPPGEWGRATVVGTLAAAACCGAMLGFGVRVGTPMRAFNAAAAVLLGDAARGIWGWDSRVTPIGILLVAVVMFVWGLLHARIASRARPWFAIVLALAIAGVAWGVSAAAVAQRLGGDAARVLGPGQLAGLHCVLAVTLVAGMRFAFSGATDDRGLVHRPES